MIFKLVLFVDLPLLTFVTVRLQNFVLYMYAKHKYYASSLDIYDK